jgi:uncharacterized protein (DUF58 family)
MTPTETKPTATRNAFVDPTVLMRIRSLELRARVVVEGFWTGLHRSPYHGFSVEFTEYRPYMAGDDLRYLDWKVLARSDRYFIKKFEDETNLRCHILMDHSQSMRFSSRGYSKAEYAATLAATLAYFLHRQGDAIGLLTFDAHVRDFLPARHRVGHLRRLLVALERSCAGTATDLRAPLNRISEMVRKRGMVVLISDFLAPIDQLEASLVPLTAAGHELIVFSILDPAEASFDYREPTLFEDLESGQKLYIDPRSARSEYRRQFDAHGQSVQSVCRRLGINYRCLLTDQPLELALFDFLREHTLNRRRLKRTGRHR